MSTPNLDIPERLLRNGRSIDPIFELSEYLYFRFQEFKLLDGEVIPSDIRFPNWSVNRDKYSQPSDVLISVSEDEFGQNPDAVIFYRDWGIARFKVEDVPPYISTGDKKLISFQVEHDPLEKNYSHAEVRAYKDEERKDTLNVSKSVQKIFRLKVSYKVTYLLYPSYAEQNLILPNSDKY